MGKYVSEDFTEEFMGSLTNEYFYLIGAECGSGKTTAIMENLVEYAKRKNKRVLFLCNRVSLYNQIHFKFMNKFNGKSIQVKSFETKDNVTLGMYQSISSLIEIMSKFEILDQHFDYIIVDEAHLIYDASDYDHSAFIFLEYLNRQKGVLIALSGTYNSFFKLQSFINREIKLLRDVDRTNNNIRRIYLITDKEKFIDLKKKYLNRGFKLIELVSSAYRMSDFRNSFSEYETACIVSKSNKNAEFIMNEDDEYFYEEIIGSSNMECDALITTKFLDVGVSINAKQNFVISYDCTEMPNTIEQFASRVRFTENSPYHLDIIFFVSKPTKRIINRLKEEFENIDIYYKYYGDYNNILEENALGFGEISYERTLINSKKVNPIRRSLLVDKIEYFERIYMSDNLLELYTQLFEKMYPCAAIINYKNKTIEDYFDNFFEGNCIRVLHTREEINDFRENLNKFKIHEGHSNELPSMNRINKFFNKENLNYTVDNPRRTINGKSQRVWEIIKWVDF